MAETNLTSGERLRVYQAVFRLNRSFHLIICRLLELGNFKIFRTSNPKKLAELRGLTQEMQVEINHQLLESLHGVEDEDWFRFGKTRIARDHRLNRERPAFGQQQKQPKQRKR